MSKTVTRCLVFVLLLVGFALVPSGPAGALPAEEKSDDALSPTLPASWVKSFNWRCVGPANMGGRITDIEVYDKDPCIWWAATASGGLLKTTNNGISFTHQFDHENTVSVGDMAVAPSDPNIVWVGTGEANPRNSVSWGDGVYKSTDGGNTWKHMGLERTFQIGRIAVHPENPDVVYVGALGRLWGPSEERGLYKTADGGKTWERILYVDDQTGVIDVQMHPEDPETLLVATYERQRDGFDSNDPKKKIGPGSALYKTSDGGETFRKIMEGLPSCHLGRIGLDYYRKDPNIVYAVVESEQIGQEPENAPYMGIQGEDVEVGARLTEIVEESPAEEAGLKTGDIVVSLEDRTVHSYQDLITAIRQYEAGDTVKMELSRDRKSEVLEVTFAMKPGEEEDAEESPEPQRRRRPTFGSGLGGQRENIQEQQGKEGHQFGGIYRSEDGGETWTRINSVNPRPMYYSQIRIDPSDENHIFVLGTSLYRSKDRGAKFTSDGGRGVHPDHHALWIDPRDGRHMILGTDGGVYVTYDRMNNWDHLNHMAIGQFYHVALDPRPNYRVFGGLQDNGTWGGPNQSRSGSGPINEDWISIGGGDGFICRVDRDDPDLVYFASQNGGMGRVNLRTGDRGYLRPRAPRGTRYRFNWMTPFILSHHNPGIYYCAGNYVFRSLYRGEKLKSISPEITNTDEGSATVLAECPINPDVLYTGTNDGAFWRTMNNGHDWENLFEISEEEPEPEEASREPADQGRPGGESVDRSRRRVGRGGSRGGSRGGFMIERMKERDANQDGKIQKEEVPERLAGFFDRMDTNGDGVVDEMELKALADRSGAGGEEAAAGVEEEKGTDQAQTTKESETEPAVKEAEEKGPGDEPADEEKAAAEKKPAEEKTASGEEGVTASDPVSGVWTTKAGGEGLPEGERESTMTLKLEEGGKVTGTIESPMGEGEVVDGKFDPENKKLTMAIEAGPMTLDVKAKLVGNRLQGTIEMAGGAFSFDFEGKRISTAAAGGAKAVEEEEDPYEWHRIDKLLPGPRWVSAIEPSRFKEGRVYLALDGHRSDDDEPYVFVSKNNGRTWRSIRGNLPTSAGSTRTIREDLVNPDILFVGAEFGVWVTIDRGKTWTRFNGNLPTVAVHEIAQHPTSGEIVAATHGRSLWILDVTPLREMNAATMKADVHLFKPNSAQYWRSKPRRGGGNPRFVGENPETGVKIYYSLGKKASRISLKITEPSGKLIKELEASSEPGLHRVTWDCRLPAPEGRRSRYRRSGPRVEPGKYIVSLTAGNQTLTQTFHIDKDPEYPDARLWGEEYDALHQEGGEGR